MAVAPSAEVRHNTSIYFARTTADNGDNDDNQAVDNDGPLSICPRIYRQAVASATRRRHDASFTHDGLKMIAIEPMSAEGEINAESSSWRRPRASRNETAAIDSRWHVISLRRLYARRRRAYQIG